MPELRICGWHLLLLIDGAEVRRYGGSQTADRLMVIMETALALDAVVAVKLGAVAIQVSDDGGWALDGTSAALLKHGSDIVKAH